MGILTYKDDQFLMDGKPYQIISGAIHYFRVVPEYWEDRLKKLKACGFNTVETYTCWNLHERKEGVFDFSGMLDIGKFIETAEKLDLNVIVRPGPYICSEWDLGGLPSWLLSYPHMGLRCNDPMYLEKVGPYYRELLSRIRPHLCTNGGRVIMVQVENEYGSYGDDKEYLRAVEKAYRDNGIDCLLFTSDGACNWMLNGGTLPDIVSVANFGSRPDKNFEALRAFKGDGEPNMCGEFWCGWFDHWYEDHHRRDPADVAANTEDMFKANASFNFYMFHGGTNFGFTNGANHTDTEYQPTITSYDDLAPVSEDGDLAPVYFAIKDVIEKYTGVKAPDLGVGNLPKAAYGKVELTQGALLLENLKNLTTPVHSARPKTMEELGQDFGYILYSTTLRGPFEPLDLIFDVHDRAIVFLNGKRIGLRERTRTMDEIKISLGKGETAQLDILVENMGRVNYGPKLFDQKGVIDGIRFGQQFHFGWDMYCLTMEDLEKLDWKCVKSLDTKDQPTFLRGTLNIEGEPKDTFVRFDGFIKGFCKINGFNLGRYFNPAGPQKTLYVPAPILKSGENEVIVFESDDFEAPVVDFLDKSDLG